MHAIVAEIFAHGAASEGRQILHWRWVRGRGGDNDGIFQRAIVFENLHKLRNGRTFLAARHIDAIELVFFWASNVDGFLIQDRVKNNSGFAGLAVTDHQFTLATTNRNKCVNGLEASGHGFIHRFARNNARRFNVHAHHLFRLDRTFAVDRISQCVNHAAKKFFTHRHFNNGAGAFDHVAFFNIAVSAKNNHTDIIGFKVQRHAFNAAGKFNHFASLHIIQPVNAGNAVTHRQNSADFSNISILAEVFDLLFED